jgi:hypothetical protein
VSNHEIHSKTFAINDYLGPDWWAFVYSVVYRVKLLCALAGEFSGVTLGITGWIRGPAVTLGPKVPRIHQPPLAAAVFGRLSYQLTERLYVYISGDVELDSQRCLF